MNILCLQGSPRKKGSTATVLGWVENELDKNGHSVEHVHIVDYKLKGCVACFACQKKKNAKPFCAIKDDGHKIFKKMLKADVILFASPLYFWDFSWQMKALIDRQMCMARNYMTPQHESFLEGKKYALLVTAGGELKNNTELIQTVLERSCEFVKTKMAGKLIVPFCESPKDLKAGVKEKVRAFARQIVKNGRTK